MIHDFKEAMGSYPTGVTVVTAKTAEGKPVGMTVNSFTSVSIEPLLVSWSIDKRSGSLEFFMDANRFAVNILAADQADVCWTFASRDETDRFDKTEWTDTDYDLPVIDGAFAQFECRKVQQIEAGDHYILIGEVQKITKNDKEPLLYYKREIGPIEEIVEKLKDA